MKALLFLASLLVLPLAALLFVQWPLRDWVGAWSRQVNDAAQVVFAIYCACAICAASRAGVHLSAYRHSADTPAPWRRLVMTGCLAPWAAFVLWTTGPQLWTSLMQFERFPDTGNPGYFLIKIATFLLALLCLLEVCRGRTDPP